jgi:membrane associated rhomboid family serine protease
VAIAVLGYLLSPHHVGLLPSLLDILFLVLLGPSVEGALGRVRFGAVCLLGGLLALAAQVLVNDGSPTPMLLSASAAIAAVLGGYLLLYPRARVLTLILVPFFVTLVELPVLIFLGLWLLTQVSLGAFGLEHYLGAGDATYLAHIGGFAFGLALVGVFARHRESVPPRLPVS